MYRKLSTTLIIIGDSYSYNRDLSTRERRINRQYIIMIQTSVLYCRSHLITFVNLFLSIKNTHYFLVYKSVEIVVYPKNDEIQVTPFIKKYNGSQRFSSYLETSLSVSSLRSMVRTFLF